MLPISALPSHAPRRLRGLLFDLDDTLLDHAKLTEAAYSSLFRLREAGFESYAVTGRPAGWASVIARQWPIDGAVAENGALAFVADEHGFYSFDPLNAEERARRMQALAALVQEIRSAFPDLLPADDVALRRSDFTFDIGERERVQKPRVAEVQAFAEARGATTLVSSVHLHVGFDHDDKASGIVRLLRTRRSLDPSSILTSYAFIGDSENDGSCFAAFQTTIGVRNLSGRPTLTPRYITTQERGKGFAEAVAALLQAGVAPAVR